MSTQSVNQEKEDKEGDTLLPKEWVVKKIGIFIKEIKKVNSALKVQNVVSITKNKGIVKSSTFFKVKVHSNDLSRYKIIKKGQFAFSPIHLNEGAIGYLVSMDEGILSPLYAVFEINKNFLNDYYLYNLLKTNKMICNYQSMTPGGVQRRAAIRFKQFSTIEIPIPPLSEQIAISNVLFKIQLAKEMSENTLGSLRKLKKSLMKHLFTNGAVSLEDASRVKLKETEIGEISVDWELVDLNEMAELIMGQSPKGDTYNTSGEGIPLINGPTEYGLKYPRTIQWTTSPTKLCKKDDILFCVRGNTLGRLNIAQGTYCIGRGVAAIRGIQNRSETSYIYYFLEFRAKTIYNSCAGQNSTFPNISGATLKKLKISKPPVLIQNQIASILQSIDEEIFSVIKEKNCLEELFKSLLSDLMSAKMRVNNLEF